MHPNKKLKLDSAQAADPFDDEDDWDDDDDILQLVASEVPTYSQMSQAVKATPIDTHTTTNGVSPPTGTKPRSFVFKRPSITASSVLSTKPTRYTSAAVNAAAVDTSAVAEAIDSTEKASNPALVTNGTSKQDEVRADESCIKMQMSDMVRKQHAHEGEIKWLRSTLKEKDNQMNTVRTNFNAEKAKQKLEYSEKERRFVKDIESLRSELQFKEIELITTTQALDRLKREKIKPKPTLKLDNDGFPVSTTVPAGSIATSNVATKLVKTEPMEMTGSLYSQSQMTGDPRCDLEPVAANRLIPRKLSAGEFKRKLLISGMLKDSMETVKSHLDVNDSKLGLCSKEQCLKLLSDSIGCAKEMCYL